MALVDSKLAYITFLDDEGQRVQTSFRVGDAETDADVNALLDAVEDLAIGLTGERGITTRSIEDTVTVASNPYAQTDIRWRIEYTDNANGRRYTTTIGTAQYGSSLKLANSEAYNPAAAAWSTFKTAFEAVVISPDGNAVTFQGATAERV